MRSEELSSHHIALRAQKEVQWTVGIIMLEASLVLLTALSLASIFWPM
jgi:hypothetical protein